MNQDPGAADRHALHAASAHTANCVCVACLAARPGITSLETELLAERLRSNSTLKLDTYQRRLLHTFTVRWNADRARRGLLTPIRANDALTQGLETLVAMVTEGAKAI